MFWRRRKLPENDEPLVPHGLIWQATEAEDSTELPPDMLDSPKDVEQVPAEPVEMRLRVSTPAQNRSQETQTLPENNQISPPLKWPRVDEAEIARRAQGIDTAVSFPYRRPIISAAVPQANEFEAEPEVAEPAKLELVETPPGPVPEPEVQPDKFRNVTAWLSEIHLPRFAPLWRRLEQGLGQVRTSASNGFQATSERLGVVRSKSSLALDAAKIRLLDRSRAAIAESRSGMQHLRETMRQADFSGASRAWSRIRSWQVTVRIPGSNKQFVSSWVTSAKSSWMMVQQTVQRDSRLWASMGMAGLSAVLALVFISAVRHYEPNQVEAQPTSIPVTPTAEPVKMVQSTALVSSRESAAAEPILPKPSPIAKSRATKQVAFTRPPAVVAPKKIVPAPSTRKRRVRRNNEEDDYVAKDTYVFYGNSGKPSR